VKDTVTLREFYADPERRLRAVVLRRAGEMGRAALALSGLLGSLRRRAAEVGSTPSEPLRGHQVLVLTTRALAWSAALRRCLMRDNRMEKATLLYPDGAPARPERPARQPADAAVGDGQSAAAEDDGQAVEAPEEESTGAPVTEAAEADVPGTIPCFVFRTAAQLDAGLRAAERRAAAGPRVPDPGARDRARRAVRDRRRCAEDEAAMVVVSGLTMAQTMMRISEDLVGAARWMGDKATIEAVRVATDDLGARFNAYAEAMQARRDAQAAEAATRQPAAEQSQHSGAAWTDLDEAELDESDLDDPDLEDLDSDDLDSDDLDLDESDEDESDEDDLDLDESEEEEPAPAPLFVEPRRFTHKDELLRRQAMRAAIAARNKPPDSG
jgi:hypothetical protein